MRAMLAARILNDQDVRTQLLSRGIEISAQTTLIAALHDTASDQVTLLDTCQLPKDSQPYVARLQTLFDSAAMTVRLTRARDHGVMNETARDVLRRSQDWTAARHLSQHREPPRGIRICMDGVSCMSTNGDATMDSPSSSSSWPHHWL